MRMSSKEFEEVTGKPAPKRKKGKKRSKYGAIPTEVDGIRFDSKREAAFYSDLKLQQQAGVVAFFLTQVPIRLPGNTKYVVDFQIFYPDGRARYVDVKGKETQMFRTKKRQVEDLYPIEIEVVK